MNSPPALSLSEVRSDTRATRCCESWPGWGGRLGETRWISLGDLLQSILHPEKQEHYGWCLSGHSPPLKTIYSSVKVSALTVGFHKTHPKLSFLIAKDAPLWPWGALSVDHSYLKHKLSFHVALQIIRCYFCDNEELWAFGEILSFAH